MFQSSRLRLIALVLVLTGCSTEVFRGRSPHEQQKSQNTALDETETSLPPVSPPTPSGEDRGEPVVPPVATPEPTTSPTPTAVNPPSIPTAPTVPPVQQTAVPTPTPNPVKTCRKAISGMIFASEGMYNQNPACGAIDSIDMVTAASMTIRIPAQAKNLKIISSSAVPSKGSCASFVMTYTTHPQGPYHYEGNCQRIAPEFQTAVGAAAAFVKAQTPAYETLLTMYCKGPKLQSLGMGKNAAGKEIAAMQAATTVEYSYETLGTCAQ